MHTDDSTIIEKLRSANRCLPEIKDMAIIFSDIQAGQVESLIKQLVDDGEDKALGILLNVCAFNKVKLEPKQLAQTLKIVYNILDFSFPYKYQDETCIQFLLDITQAKDISWERQAYAGRLAAEIAVRFGLDRQPVRKILWKLSNEVGSPEATWMIDQSLDILELKDINEMPYLWLSQADLLKALPEEKPPVIIGGDYSVRRPVVKISRNAPCPCGSGKKYKKCCYEKDQELLRDASPFEGLTRTEIQASPSLVDNADFIYDMRAYQLRRLKPGELNEAQLVAAYERAETFGLYELALEILLELKKRPVLENPADLYMADLLEAALDANEIEFAKKVRKKIKNDYFDDADDIDFRFMLLENARYFAELDRRCKLALCETDKFQYQFLLSHLTYNFENIFPALCVVFGRAAIASHPDRVFENDMLIEVINNARIALDLEPWNDPIEDYFDWAVQKNESDMSVLARSKEIEELKQQVTEAQKISTRKTNELSEKEGEIERLLKKLVRMEEERHKTKDTSRTASERQFEEEEALKHLRQRVKNLKEEISAQQQARAQLRKQLRETQKEVLASEQAAPESEVFPEEGTPLEFEETPKKILIPEYTDVFRQSCESLSPAIVAKALRAIANFAVQDKSVWPHTRQIEVLDGIYRIRIGLHYRLIIRWQPGLQLQVLDLIPRQNLETWIKQRL